MTSERALATTSIKLLFLAIVATAVVTSLATAALVLTLMRSNGAAPADPQSTVLEVTAGRATDATQLTGVYNRVAPAVVHIMVRTEAGGGTGSGFVLREDGIVLTNNHVVADAHEIVVVLSDGTELLAEIVGRDPSTDIALLAVNSSVRLPTISLGDSEAVQIGEPAIVVGSPFGLQQSLTAGYISALNRTLRSGDEYGTEIDGVIQTDAAVNPGNSGGPLLNAAGEVVGITTAIFTTSGGFEGLGFAVPINTAREISEQILDQGYVQRPFLGIAGFDLTPQLARRLALSVDAGVLIQGVHTNSAADEAGIRAGDQTFNTPIGPFRLGGDILIEIEGERIDSMAEANRVIQQFEIGQMVEFTFLRNGKETVARGQLGEHPRPD